MLDCLLLLHCTKLSAVSVVETVSKLNLAAAGTELSSLCKVQPAFEAYVFVLINFSTQSFNKGGFK